MEKTNFLFNEASGAHWAKLKPEQQQFLSQAREDMEKQVETLKADHLVNRDQHVADKEESLLQHYKAQLNLPRPKGVLPPRLKTGPQIRSEAECAVDKAYTNRLQEIKSDHQKAEREYIKKALGIEPRGPSAPDHGIDRNH